MLLEKIRFLNNAIVLLLISCLFTIKSCSSFTVLNLTRHYHSEIPDIRIGLNMYSESEETSTPHCPNVLFVECGFGNDSHGQSATKAAVRACRNAIEFNSIPSLRRIIPSDKELKLDVILAVPKKYQDGLDLEQCRKVFPYGDVKFTVQDGGMIAPSGIAIDDLGDASDDMVIANCAVIVGF